MKRFLIFIGGFIVGVLVTTYVSDRNVTPDEPIDDGLVGLTIFTEKGECIKTSSKSKSSEIEIYRVLEPNMALGTINNFTDRKIGDNYYRDHDYDNDVAVLLINYDGKTYYDDQKIDVTNKCVRQIGTYQYSASIGKEKTVPAVVLE